MQSLDDAVGLRPLHARALMFDLLELGEEFVGMLVVATAKFAAIIAEYRIDPRHGHRRLAGRRCSSTGRR